MQIRASPLRDFQVYHSLVVLNCSSLFLNRLTEFFFFIVFTRVCYTAKCVITRGSRLRKWWQKLRPTERDVVTTSDDNGKSLSNSCFGSAYNQSHSLRLCSQYNVLLMLITRVFSSFLTFCFVRSAYNQGLFLFFNILLHSAYNQSHSPLLCSQYIVPLFTI